MSLEVSTDTGNFVDIVSRLGLIFHRLEIVPADGSVGTSPSTVGLVTFLSNLMKPCIAPINVRALDLQQLRRNRCLSQISTKYFQAQLKSHFQVELTSYCFLTEYFFDQVREPNHRYGPRTKSLVRLSYQWLYSDFVYGQRF